MPEGLVTIVFTDVEDSTALARAVGDQRAKELIERQRAVVREALVPHRGREIDAAGDGFMLAFESVRAALAFARTVQNELAEQGEGVRVRIGVHAGEVLERDGHPFGAAVNGAARVSARAKGGEVLVSDTVRQLAGELTGLRFRDRGKARLKGFEEPWRLYQLDWEGRREMPLLVARPKRRRPTWLYTAAALLAVAAGLGAWLAWPSGAKSLVAAPNTVAAVDPATGRVVAVMPTGTQPSQVVADGRRVWVASVRDRTVTIVDSRSRRAVGTIALPLAPFGIAAEGNTAWASDADHYVEIDPILGPGQPQAWPAAQRFFPQNVGLALAVHRGDLWRGFEITLMRVPLAGGAVAVISRELGGVPAQLAFWQGGVWSAGVFGLDRWSPASGTTHVSSAGPLDGIVTQPQALWATDAFDETVVRFNTVGAFGEPLTQTFPLDEKARGITAVGNELWTANDDGSMTEFDPQAGKIVRRIRVGGSLTGIAYSNGLLWVSVQQP